MKLQLGLLSAASFKSFTTLEFDLRDFGSGLHFLRGQNKLDPALGSNGAGKSTLWDAVCWCLYGRTPSGLKTTDVRPWQGSGPTSVWLEANGKTVQRSTHGTKLSIDGKECGQADVERLVGLSVDSFCHTVVLGQGQPLFFDLPPREKMDLFSSVLDLDRWDERADFARERAVALEKLEAMLAGKRGGMVGRQGFVEKELVVLKERAAEWSKAQMQKLSALEAELKKTQKRITALTEQHDRADLAYDGAMMDLKLLDKDHDRLLQQINSAAMDWERHDLRVAKLREERDQIDFDLNHVLPVTCDRCGQPIGGRERKLMRERMEDRADDLDAKIKADLHGPALLARVQELKQEEERLRATADGFKQRADKARATLDMSTPLLAELKAFVNSGSKTEEELKNAVNPFSEQVSERRREREKLNNDLEALAARMKRLSGQIERTKFWSKGFRDVRLYKVDSLMAELEMATNTMLPEVGLDGWQVHYDIERTSKKGTAVRGISTLILSPDNQTAVNWKAWSGGEGQRLRLVGALAFADVLLRHAGVQTSLEVLDEPTQHLSSQGVRDLVEFLAGRAQAYQRAIFFIDHHAVESARFDSVTTIVKDDAGSRVQVPLVSLSTAT